jgi:hypothetical protein
MSQQSSGNLSESNEEHVDEGLLRAAVRLNTWILAGVFGFVIGVSLLGLTYASLLRGLPRPGQYLNLLGVFLPGYEVSHAGAWVGLFWGAIIGALCAVAFYRIYARGMSTNILRVIIPGGQAEKPTGAVLLIHGHYLGLAMGSVLAAGLIVSTNWLVLRGTAATSVHAKLLVNYLPGYTVSPIGSLIGAVELFVVAYLASRLFSAIYNRIASARGDTTP